MVFLPVREAGDDPVDVDIDLRDLGVHAPGGEVDGDAPVGQSNILFEETHRREAKERCRRPLRIDFRQRLRDIGCELVVRGGEHRAMQLTVPKRRE